MRTEAQEKLLEEARLCDEFVQTPMWELLQKLAREQDDVHKSLAYLAPEKSQLYMGVAYGVVHLTNMITQTILARDQFLDQEEMNRQRNQKQEQEGKAEGFFSRFRRQPQTL